MFVLVIHTDGRVYGTFDTFRQGVEAAKRYFGDGYDHARTNNDFLVLPLMSPALISEEEV